jgi:hypothetical protein
LQALSQQKKAGHGCTCLSPQGWSSLSWAKSKTLISKIIRVKRASWGRIPVSKMQSPEFKPQYHQKKQYNLPNTLANFKIANIGKDVK